MSIEEMITVLQGYRDGKTIQYRDEGSNDSWTDDHCGPYYDFSTFEYRVKPEPKEIWATVYPGNSVHYAYNSEAEFEKAHLGFGNIGKPKLFREVI